ncbi:hypothetical protein C8034_v003946 [Colletotrichum sidae]|uniref:Zn(2)-C6 fungal-type domain-containing protein n=1 Tax=Colletotrichum sidae TaxID=1347389 RepID=A0A4R8TP30_9PEZI|nr:hypothetical protein C8034_v003946 [Colletotrichum sidae]
MVYHGRPSPACFPCRSRKLRCDLQPDACGQCRRARIACHGYRDPDALQFRDETVSVEQKAVSRRHGHPLSSSVSTLPVSLDLGWDTRARYAFFTTYIGGFTRSMAEVAHHYRAARGPDHLSASVEAASLAFMAVQLGGGGGGSSSDGSPHHLLLGLARASYLAAIQRLGRALPRLGPGGEAEEALTSVLLLDMYEKMTRREPEPGSGWMSHARGGLTLLDSRTADIVSSPTGCATVGASTPRELGRLRRNMGYRLGGPKWSFLGVLGRVSDLQVAVERGEVSRSEFVVRAKSLDDQVAVLERGVPPTWVPQRRTPTAGGRDDPLLLLGGYYDVYADHYTVQVTNALRLMRLIVYRLVERLAPGHGHAADPGFREVVVRTLTRGICASVAQFALPRTSSPANSLPFSPVQRLQCGTFLTPLYFVHQVSEEVSVRDWVRRSVRFMWEAGGLRAARDIDDLMGAEPDLDYWAVFAKTGSYAFAA